MYKATGAVMRCNHASNALFHGIDEDAIRRKYVRMWGCEGYDSKHKNDLDFMLHFLCQHGEGVLVGKHLRDRSMLLPSDGRSMRQVCETVHRAMKRWVNFSIFRLVKRTREARIKCRFLCLQLLSVLFKGYMDYD